VLFQESFEMRFILKHVKYLFFEHYLMRSTRFKRSIIGYGCVVSCRCPACILLPANMMLFHYQSLYIFVYWFFI